MPCWLKTRFLIIYSTKKGAARGWGLAYQASSIDLTHQSHTLDPALKASRARRAATIQLLLKDVYFRVAYSGNIEPGTSFLEGFGDTSKANIEGP